jgi:hypothetical protein
MSAIASWSHSRLATFEQCRFRAEQLYAKGIKEPERPLPPGKTEHANDRGTRVHEDCEKYVRGLVPDMPKEARKHFGPELERLRELYPHGVVQLEGEWGMSRDWQPWDWRGQWVEVPGIVAGEPFERVKVLPPRPRAHLVYSLGKKHFVWTPPWLRLKLDILVFESPTKAIAIDLKTGKKFGNELKHGEQLNLYQLVTFLRYPQLEEVTTELWYTDVDDLTRKVFTRDQGLRFQRSWDKRGNAITTAESFPPNGNIHSCRWCMLGERPGGMGICKSGKW